jgi:hypothetical protein
VSQLTDYADQLYISAVDTLNHSDAALQRNKAVEISSFLQIHGDQLDSEGAAGTVDQLSLITSQLINAAGPLQQDSPTLTGVRAYIADKNKLDSSAIVDKAKEIANKLPGGWIPWALGAAVLIGLGLLGYGLTQYKTVKAIVK